MFVNGDEKTGAKLLNKMAREEMKTRLLQDVLFDLQVCKLEGWDCKEYIDSLKNEIDQIYKEVNKC